MRQVRQATADDLDAIAALTQASRARLAGWAPDWWRVADGADELHPLWLGHLIGAEGIVVRVVTDSGAVVGCAVSMPQGPQWFVDDVAVVDDRRWADAGEDLLTAVEERPALTCVPTDHLARRAASLAAGLHHVSSYWIRRTEAGPDVGRPGLPPGLPLPPAPPHTFGGALDPDVDGALVLGTADGGLIGSPSVSAPPVYAPGGTVTVVDRVVGDAPSLLQQALAATAARGDVLLAVVVGVDDRRLRNAVHDLAFTRTVDVFAWP